MLVNVLVGPAAGGFIPPVCQPEGRRGTSSPMPRHAAGHGCRVERGTDPALAATRVEMARCGGGVARAGGRSTRVGACHSRPRTPLQGPSCPPLVPASGCGCTTWPPRLTAYAPPTARLSDEAGIDLLLVGDSIGDNMLAHENTLPVTLAEMLPPARAVARSAKRAMVVVDLPFGSYEGGAQQAYSAA